MNAYLEGDLAPSSQDWVRAEVAHYRSTGSGLRGRPVVLLDTRGARTGLVRTTPLMRVWARGTYAVVASAGGADAHPAWYRNVVADPHVVLQDGDLRLHLVARETHGAERSLWWSRANAVFPSYARYQSATRRRIPVLMLEPDEGMPQGRPSGRATAGTGGGR